MTKLSDDATHRARERRMAKNANGCPVYKTLCAEHGFTHGAEAEELRNGIEAILMGHNDHGVMLDELQHLLDATDARDSLAYLEVTDRAKDARRKARM